MAVPPGYPIPQSFYRYRPPTAAHGAEPPSPVSEGGRWDFLIRRHWKLAGLGVAYALIAAYVARVAANPWLAAFFVAVLWITLLVSNGWGLRRWLPPFRSGNLATAATAWTISALLVFASALGALAADGPVPRPVSSGITATPSPSLSAADAAAPTPVEALNPPVQPRAAVLPAKARCGAPPNPWAYNLCGGSLVDNPPPDFCVYFPCVVGFWKQTLGFIDQCRDGTYSHSGGTPGACSLDSGEARRLYQ